MLDRLFRPTCLRQRNAQVDVGIYKVGFLLQGLPVTFDGLLILTCDSKSVAHVIERLVIIGSQ